MYLLSLFIIIAFCFGGSPNSGDPVSTFYLIMEEVVQQLPAEAEKNTNGTVQAALSDSSTTLHSTTSEALGFDTSIAIIDSIHEDLRAAGMSPCASPSAVTSDVLVSVSG